MGFYTLLSALASSVNEDEKSKIGVGEDDNDILLLICLCTLNVQCTTNTHIHAGGTMYTHAAVLVCGIVFIVYIHNMYK